MTRTHCKHGHPWTEDTTFVNQRGIRECRTCRLGRQRAYKAKRRALGLKDTWVRKRPEPGPVTCPDCGEVRILASTHPTAIGSGRCQSCAMKNYFRKRGTMARDVDCRVCGKTFRAKGRRAPMAKVCSTKCHGEYLRLKMRGTRRADSNPNYRHGKDIGRKNWNVAAKGDTHCRVCGATDRLHLHHTIPRSKYRAGREELRNGIALCPTCHAKWHNNSLTIYRDVFTQDEWQWLTSVQLTGERIEAWLDKHYPARPTEWELAA